MSTHRFRRIDRRTAEQLLCDAPSSRQPAAPDALGELLDAAAGPAREGELAGEQAAVAAFHATRLDPDLKQRRLSMIKTMLAGLLTAKILIPAAAAAAVGGVTLAGATGTLPLPEDTPTGPPAEVTTAPRAPESTPAGEGAVPEQGQVGLCLAYTAGTDAERGKALDSPAFEVLVTEAGGEDNVASYCTDLLAERPGKPADVPSTAPATPDHPTGEPDGVPSTTRSPQPTSSLTARPEPSAPTSTTDYPTGKPTPAHPAGASAGATAP